MPREIYLPPQVLQAIREHVEKAVRHAESGYTSAQEEEDTVTGELGGALRTDGEQVVNVTDGNLPGTWRWSITYSKFGSKSQDATESIVGADGILEIRVGSPERDQRKSALFQAKNTLKRDPKLIEQCAKMSIWREAAFVISYTAKGYKAYTLDDILIAQGSIAKANNGTPVAPWIIDTFIGCRIGHSDLYYNKDERRLYWLREKLSEGEYEWNRRVWVDFSPKYLIHIDVTPPNWQWSGALEIKPDKIPLSRLEFTSSDLFGIEAPFTLTQLKKRRAELLHAYHADKSHHVSNDIQALLNARTREIIQAFSELSEKVTAEKKTSKNQKANKTKSSAGLEGPRTPTVDEFFTKGKVGRKVKVRKGKKKHRSSS